MEKQNELKTSLAILSLEDSKRDFEIIRELLIGEGYDLKMDRVENEHEFIAALSDQKYDIILSEFKLPGYDAFAALKKSIEISPDVPFIVVSRNRIDVSAIELIKQGAVDYVQKDNLERLPVAINQADEEVREKEKVNKKLKFSNERYQLIFDNAPDALFISDLKGVPIEVNRATEKLLGLSSKDIIGKVFLKLGLLQKNQIPKAYKLLTKGILSKAQKAEEFTLKRKDGTEIFLELRVHFIKYHGENHMLGIARDITKRKQSENELRESEERFKRFFNDLGDAVFVTKVGGTDAAQILEVNPAAEKQTGYTRDDLLKMNIARDISVIGSSQGRLVDWDEALLNGQKVSSVEKKKRKDNTEYWTKVVVTPIDFKGEKACLSINHDITERKQAENALIESEAQLRELNATKDKFFRIIAHDLKSPFNSILGFSSLLIEEIQEKDYERIEEFAGYIKRSSHRAMDLLMNLMEWSQLQTGKMDFTPFTIDLHELINEIIELLNDAAQLKSITISTELPDNMHVSADKAMLGTILRNLVSNAIKFTHPGGTIVISAEQRQNECMICVRDSGVGIIKENLDKLFCIEESLSTAGTQKEKGTGLGLILCKEFAEKHGGRIWVESQYGIGSQFYFTLPEIK